MPEVSLYRKYRPQNFNNLVGQDHIRTTILNALKDGHPAHAYLFCGPRGTGKTSTARLLAKAINCTDPSEEGEPCDKCEMCTLIKEGTLIDLAEIDAASNRGIDEIRDLKDKINFAPTRAKNKIYIIDEVHMLTKEAFNALLKTLEEPPAQVFFVLATTEIHKVPETIISRCQRFDFKRITKKAIATRLMYIAQMEGIEAEQSAVDAIAHNAEGGLRDAIGLFEQLTTEKVLKFDRVREVLGISGQSALDSFYKQVSSNNTKGALNEIQNIYTQGIDLVQFAKDFLEYLRQKMLSSAEQGDMMTTKYLLETIDSFQEAYSRLKSTTIPQLPLEMAVIECTTKDVPAVIPIQYEPSVMPAPTPIPEVDENTEKQEEDAAETTVQAPEILEERKHASIKSPLTISYVKENWPRIIDLIKTPFVRMSFKEGRPVKVENGTITIEFSSSFHKEKIDTTEVKFEIESAISSIFETPAKIEFTIGKVELAAQPTAQEIAGFFGGEVVKQKQEL